MYNHLTVSKQMTDVQLLVLDSSTWNHLTVCKQIIYIVYRIIRFRNSWNHLAVCKNMSSSLLKNVINKMYLQIQYI